MEKRELSYTMGGNVNWCNHYEKQYGRGLKTHRAKLNRATIWFSHLAPGHISGQDENSNLKRFIHSSVNDSTVYNSQDMEIT